MIFRIDIPIYKTYIWVYTQESKETIIKHTKKVYKEHIPEEVFELEEETEARVVTFNGYPKIVIFKDNLTPSVVSHEMLHVTSTLLRGMGLNLSDSSEEAFCYLLEYLVEEFFKKVKINLED